MTKSRDDNPAVRMNREDLFEAYFNRELSSQLQMELDELLERDAGAAQVFAQMKFASDALGQPISGPDNTNAILAEVGHRRGWIGARLQRFVSIGRLAIAATFLLTITATLAAKRFMPDAAIFPSQSTPLTDVADCAADDAQCGVNDFFEAVNSLGASATSRINVGNWSLVPTGPVTINASLIAADRHPDSQKVPCNNASTRFSYTVRMMSLGDGSFRKLAGQQRVGSVVIFVGSPSQQADTKNEKDSSVTGW